jgi:NAD+ synthase (glutamine-hydrolysing)
MRLALVELNPTVGDFGGNLQKIISLWEEADRRGADLVLFPEFALCGYPPEDLLLREEFLKQSEKTLKKLLEKSKNFNSVGVLGYPKLVEGGFVYNALGVVYKGKLLGEYYKHYLPNYGVFDEYRYFKKGEHLLVLRLGGAKVGFLICEDVWHPTLAREYALLGIDLLAVINASPYEGGKFERKLKFVAARSTDGLHYTAYANLVGGQDSLVFDGRSFVVSPQGEVLLVSTPFEEELSIIDLDLDAVKRARLLDQRVKEASLCEGVSHPVRTIEVNKKLSTRQEFGKFEYKPPEREEELFRAIVVGIRDYFRKQGFEKAILGLSGGIDSALVATLAAEALGPENVLALYMPTEFNSNESYEDAKRLAQNLGIHFKVVEIEPFFERFEELFSALFEGWRFDTADENIQARIRANVLFYFSNKEGYLVLATSNKSEAAVGYTTIYGDMAGGFAPIKDLYKTEVYALARWINRKKGREVIPKRIIEKPPSAELRPNQRDQDTLPPYEILDAILKLYVEEGMSPSQIAERGFDKRVVERVVGLLHRAEYKRKQAPIGVKVSKVSFDKDWRMPIVKKINWEG